MTRSSWQPLPRDLVNPFNPAGVAYLTRNGPAPVTVRSRVVGDALTLLERYLRIPADEGATGQSPADGAGPADDSAGAIRCGDVLAIVGDYGMGKTHLCIDLVQAARTDPRQVAVYLAAQAPTFRGLYLDLVAKFTQAEVTALVRRYYALATIDLLRQRHSTAALADEVAAGRVDAQQLVQLLSLPEARVVEIAKQRMARVTAQPDFPTVLSLLLRPGFEASAWQWLVGGAPDGVLRERGVKHAIDDDVSALEAIGVLALLHNHPGQRFVLVIDELQQVLHTAKRPPAEAEQAFKSLLTICVNAGAFLVLSGVSGFLDAISPEVRERIANTVSLQRWDEAEVADFITRTVRTATGRASSDPFTTEAVAQCADSSGGVPRAVSRLCHHAFARSLDVGTPVSRDLVQEIAENVLGTSTTDSVRHHLDRVLSSSGSWRHQRDIRLGAGQRSRVDHVVYLAGGRRCGILVVDGEPGEGRPEALSNRVDALRADVPDLELLLVVRGRATAAESERFRLLAETDPLPYRPVTFAADLLARLRELDRQVGSPPEALATEADGLTELTLLSRQQADAQRELDRIVELLEGFRLETQDELRGLRRRLSWARAEVPDDRTVAAGTSPAGVEAVGDEPSGRLVPLPPQLRVLFDNALEALADLPEFGRVLHEVFARAAREADGRPALSPDLYRTLRSPETNQALSAGVQLRALVAGFREAVRAWLTDPPADREPALRALCLAFDSVYPAIAVNHLEGARHFAGKNVSARVEQVREALNGLGAQVERRALDAVPGN
jgi:type II secretory pathway predicted ATPase ExeA